MNIALIHNYPLSNTTGGAERTAFKILEYLRVSSFNVVYCTLGTSSNYVFSEKMANGIKHYHFPKRNPFQDLRGGYQKMLFHIFELFNFVSFLDLWRVTKKEDFRFIFFHNPRGFSFAIWICAILRGIPFCLVNHDYYNLCLNSCFFKKNAGTCRNQCVSCRTFRFIPWLLHFFSDFAIFLSLNQKKIFNAQGWFLGKKAFIVPPSVDTGRYKPKNAFTHKIGFIGRLDSTKGVNDFLLLCKLLKYSDLTFYIQAFKSDPFLLYYKSKSADIKNLKWVHKGNLTFLREIDFLVAPSQWEEPFGRVFLESLSVGTPCIGYRRGAIAEIMTKDLSIFLPRNFEIHSIKEKLLFFYKNEKNYTFYSRLCIERYKFFRQGFSKAMNSVVSRV